MTDAERLTMEARIKRLRKWSVRGWLLAVALAVIAGVAGKFAWSDRARLSGELSDARRSQALLRRTQDEQKAREERLKAELAESEQTRAKLDGKARQLDQQTAAARVAAERQEKLIVDLKAALEGTGVEIAADRDRVVIAVPEAALFPEDGLALGPGGLSLLAAVGKTIKSVSDREVFVGGHAAAAKVKKGPGKPPSPWQAGAARALAVAQHLVRDARLDARRVTVAAAGTRRTGKRAVEIALVPLAPARP